MILWLMGSHLVRPEFGSSARGQLILSSGTEENCSARGRLSSSFKIGRRITVYKKLDITTYPVKSLDENGFNLL